MAEAADLKSVQYRFESDDGHRKRGKKPMIALCGFCGYDGKTIVGFRPRPSTKKVRICASCLGAIGEDTQAVA